MKIICSWYICLMLVTPQHTQSHAVSAHKKRILHASVLLISCIQDAYHLLRNTYKHNTPVDPSVDTYVRTILYQYNCPPSIWKKIRIVHGNTFASDTIHHTLEVPLTKEKLSIITHVHACKKTNCHTCQKYAHIINKHTPALIIGALLHEAGHVAHNDAQRWLATTIASPIISYAFLKHIGNHPALQAIKKRYLEHTYAWQRHLFLLTTTILASEAIIMLVRKNSEYQADKFAQNHINDPDILTHIAHDFAHDHTLMRAQLHPVIKKLYDIFPILYENITPYHPSNLQRSQAFLNSARKKAGM